jgi:hypothetical protein
LSRCVVCLRSVENLRWICQHKLDVGSWLPIQSSPRKSAWRPRVSRHRSTCNCTEATTSSSPTNINATHLESPFLNTTNNALHTLHGAPTALILPRYLLNLRNLRKLSSSWPRRRKASSSEAGYVAGSPRETRQLQLTISLHSNHRASKSSLRNLAVTSHRRTIPMLTSSKASCHRQSPRSAPPLPTSSRKAPLHPRISASSRPYHPRSAARRAVSTVSPRLRRTPSLSRKPSPTVHMQ